MKLFRACAVIIVVAVFLAPALYVLSSGPAFAMLQRQSISEAEFLKVFYPLAIATDRSEVAHLWLWRYWSWWGDLPDLPER